MPIYKLRNLKSGQAMLIPLGEFVVGRAEGSDLPIDDLSISRRHARMINNDSGLFVEDSGSANGTSLAGLPINRRMALKVGDVLHFGTVPVRIDPEVANLRPEPLPQARVATAEVVEGETIRLPEGRSSGSGRANGRITGTRKTAVISTLGLEPEPVATPGRTLPDVVPLGSPPRITSPEVSRAKTAELLVSGSAASGETRGQKPSSPVTAQRNVAPSAPAPSRSSRTWLWLLLGFLAGLGVGLAGGLMAARFFLELGGKISGLP